MKKLITKTLSMILMLAMVLSMTAMAASTNKDIVAQREASTNWHAWIDFMHSSDKWTSIRNNNNGTTGPIVVPGWDTKHMDDIGTYYDKDSNERGASYEGFEDKFPDYESPYGGVIETWNYLNTHFETTAANGWLRALHYALDAYRSDRLFTADKDSVFYREDHECRTGVVPTLSAYQANRLLTYITTEFNDEFVTVLNTYGKDAAAEFGFYRTCVNLFVGHGGDTGVPKDRTVEQTFDEYVGTRPWKPLVTTDKPAANTQTPVESKNPTTSVMTILVNGKPVEFEIVILTDAKGGATTYFKLRDVGEAMNFNVDWNANTGISVSDK